MMNPRDDLSTDFDVFNELFFGNEEFLVIPDVPSHLDASPNSYDLSTSVGANPENVERSDFSIIKTSSSSDILKEEEEEEKEKGKVCRDSDSSVNERLSLAVRYIKESYKEGDILIQIWVPERIQDKDREVLTTYGHPFQLDLNCQRLVDYRKVSTTYHFSADVSSDEALGLPGRVFLGKVPEWTPDVRLFSSFEYPRVDHAQRFGIRGSLALPVFDRINKSCLGVLEVVMTTEKIKYSSDLDNICNALQAVDLGSSEILSVPHVKLRGDSYQSVLPEIHQVLRIACTVHNLPLAQTWIPCHQQGKTGSRHISENYNECISTVDLACYINEPTIFSFHRACSEHHLFKGQGVAGKAFTTNQPCFVSDITSFSRTEYPLSHHAKMFNLGSAVAIRLRSIHNRSDDFVLEFFLPLDCIGAEEQKLLLNSLSSTIQHYCRSLRVLYAHEIETGLHGANNLISSPGNQILGESPWNAGIVETQEKHDENLIPSKMISIIDNNECGDQFTVNDVRLSKSSKVIEKRRGGVKIEKSVSLQVLQQYFTGSLKDAAKSLGVCPTTLKRICRQHGIARWPSRKIKKVSHSLRKLQVVINSVQGTDQGPFPLNSFYNSFSNAHASADSITQPDDGGKGGGSGRLFDSTHASASSCSTWSYSSKQSCSSGAKTEPLMEDCTANHNSMTTKISSKQVQINGLRLKVIYGEEMVRFRLLPSWGYQELKKEIADRFEVAVSSIDLKYLDDDSEWVLLTCDADLQECVDIYKSSGVPTVKISVHLHNPKP